MFTPTNFFKSPLVRISEEVKSALSEKRAVVALESTIIAHGMPYPQNLEVALAVEQIVRDAGATPATIAVVGGKICIGLTERELETIAREGAHIWKLNTRDLPYAISRGESGATTVSATIYCAEGASIPIMVTGGIGGVHREVAGSWDISADLTELSLRRVAVFSAGIKSILDIPKTLEYLETLSVPVIAHACDEFPAFYTRKSGVSVKTRLEDAPAIAAFLRAMWEISSTGGAMIATPIPEAAAAAGEMIEAAIATALKECSQKGISGKGVTPFLLERVCTLTKGESLKANIALVKNNAKLGADVAVSLTKNT
ncbi:MAG: pseudouridine-5'-phosphate glycosidase [Oligoflexia bacterium]|nr:pseudouridine-5'-phosphate glycosidase [Oligoflexia bacterium]MBF0367696.1 pseudouridine-5'-phosphate glycosidase [Oligoflexia bacterium]